MKRTVRSALSAALLGVTALSTGCASRPETTLEVTWAAPQLPPAKSFSKLLIITVAPSEFVQEAFQNQMAAELKKRGVNAVASRRYFTRYTDAERDRFMKSIADSDASIEVVAAAEPGAAKEVPRQVIAHHARRGLAATQRLECSRAHYEKLLHRSASVVEGLSRGA